MAVAYEFIKDFLRKHEGNVLRGYVPCKEKPYYGGPGRKSCGPVLYSSGVTLAAGLDLGQQSVQDMHRMGLDSLLWLLRPYLGLKREDACDALTALPLTITPEQCFAINSGVHNDYIRRAGTEYIKDSAFDFAELPKEAQTVIVSLFYHLGSPAKFPVVWEALCHQDWPGAAHELKTGFTKFSSRRAEEGYLLERI